MADCVERLTKTASRSTYVALAVLSGAALAAASLLPLDPPDVLPCGFLVLTGWPCPFCGTTRAFTAMGHGHIALAAAASPLAALFYVLTAAVFAMAAAGVAFPAAMKPVRDTCADLTRRRWVWITVAGLVLANWAYRLAAGFK